TLAILEPALPPPDVLVMLVDHNEFKAVSGDSVTQAFIVDTKGVWR
ncbi:UDP-N-acetyl-D-mannosamine dehydrogenase, partial [Klebsiella pneumoniae]